MSLTTAKFQLRPERNLQFNVVSVVCRNFVSGRIFTVYCCMEKFYLSSSNDAAGVTVMYSGESHCCEGLFVWLLNHCLKLCRCAPEAADTDCVAARCLIRQKQQWHKVWE